MREKQQAVVQAFGIASRDNSSSDIDKYLFESLKVHMVEAIGSRPPCALSEKWLDVNDDAFHMFLVIHFSFLLAGIFSRKRKDSLAVISVDEFLF